MKTQTNSNEFKQNEFYSIQLLSKIFDITDGFVCHILFMMNLLYKTKENEYIANENAIKNKLIFFSKKKNTFYVSNIVFNDFNHLLKVYKKNSIKNSKKNYKKYLT